MYALGVLSVTRMHSVKFRPCISNSKIYDDNMQIGFEATPDEDASIVPLRCFFSVLLSFPLDRVIKISTLRWKTESLLTTTTCFPFTPFFPLSLSFSLSLFLSLPLSLNKRNRSNLPSMELEHHADKEKSSMSHLNFFFSDPTIQNERKITQSYFNQNRYLD